MGERRTLRSLAAVALFTAIAFLGGGPWQAEAVSGVATVSPVVVESLGDDGATRIVVTLRIAPLRGDGAGGADIPARKAEVRDGTARVLAAIAPADFEVHRTYQATPRIAGSATAAGIAALARHPDVVSIEPDAPMYGALNDSVPLIGADDVHGLGITGEGVTVAVLDSGIDSDHPELADDLTYQRCFTFGVCPTAAGVIVGCGGSGATSSFFAEDGASHGSHVAGIITKSGVPNTPGVAPDASIKAFKILNDCGSGQGFFSDMEAALDEIIANRPGIHDDVDIINMSIVDGQQHAAGTCEIAYGGALADEIALLRTMGVITFVSSGNSGFKTGLGYPACITDAVSVGATYDANLGSVAFTACTDPVTAADAIACWSQSDSSLDLLAPGSRTLSTVPGGTGFKSGTSMASPTAAGVAALLLDDEPGLTPSQIETRLKQTGKPIVDGFNGVTTCRVDAYQAIINDGGPACPGNDNDGIAAPPDNCPSHDNPLQEDNDASGGGWTWIADGVTAEGLLAGGDVCDPNDDNDRCRDVIEPTLAPARNPLSPWDFADMWVPALPASGTPTGGRNGAITLADALAVVTWAGTSNGGPPNTAGLDYDNDVNLNGVDDGAEYDRASAGVSLSAAPNGAVTLSDALVVVSQVGDVC